MLAVCSRGPGRPPAELGWWQNRPKKVSADRSLQARRNPRAPRLFRDAATLSSTASFSYNKHPRAFVRMVDFKDPSPTSTLETRSLSNSPPAGQERGAAATRDDVRSSLAESDEAVLARLGYKQEFVREFTNLSVSPYAPSPVRQAAPPFFSVSCFIPLLQVLELNCGHTMCYRPFRSRSRSWGKFPIRPTVLRRAILGPRSANRGRRRR